MAIQIIGKKKKPPSARTSHRHYRQEAGTNNKEKTRTRPTRHTSELVSALCACCNPLSLSQICLLYEISLSLSQFQLSSLSPFYGLAHLLHPSFPSISFVSFSSLFILFSQYTQTTTSPPKRRATTPQSLNSYGSLSQPKWWGSAKRLGSSDTDGDWVSGFKEIRWWW